MGTKTRFYADIMTYHPEVTGSLNLVVVKFPDGTTSKFIVDCGLFQEREHYELNAKLPFDPETLDFVLVTHNHVDHTGRLPFLIEKGYYKKIYTSKQTARLLPLALADSYRVLNSTAIRQHKQVLYSADDVERTLQKVVGCEYEKEVKLTDRISAVFLNNGHLLGAAMILVKISYPGEENINILFTGDYNKENMFFDVNPVPKEIRDLRLTIVEESTYGDMESTEKKPVFEENIAKAIVEGKTILVPVFSLGRAQEILYIIKKMQTEGRISDNVPIYFDGKLAFKYTGIYHEKEMNLKPDMKDFLPKNLVYVSKTIREEIIYDPSPKIILTTSGMGSYGPAQTYIPKMISHDNVLIQFTGYTAEGTLGARLKQAKIGDIVDVSGVVTIKRADVEYTAEYSAHAKADELIDLLKQFNKVNLVLINHGEHETKERYARRVVKEVKTKEVGILGEGYFFRINPYGLVKTMSAKFN